MKQVLLAFLSNGLVVGCSDVADANLSNPPKRTAAVDTTKFNREFRENGGLAFAYLTGLPN